MIEIYVYVDVITEHAHYIQLKETELNFVSITILPIATYLVAYLPPVNANSSKLLTEPNAVTVTVSSFSSNGYTLLW